MHLEIGVCEHYCVQMTFVILGTIGKCSGGKKTSILDRVCLNYENPVMKITNHPVQCTACTMCQCSS